MEDKPLLASDQDSIKKKEDEKSVVSMMDDIVVNPASDTKEKQSLDN